MDAGGNPVIGPDREMHERPSTPKRMRDLCDKALGGHVVVRDGVATPVHPRAEVVMGSLMRDPPKIHRTRARRAQEDEEWVDQGGFMVQMRGKTVRPTY